MSVKENMQRMKYTAYIITGSSYNERKHLHTNSRHIVVKTQRGMVCNMHTVLIY